MCACVCVQAKLPEWQLGIQLNFITHSMHSYHTYITCDQIDTHYGTSSPHLAKNEHNQSETVCLTSNTEFNKKITTIQSSIVCHSGLSLQALAHLFWHFSSVPVVTFTQTVRHEDGLVHVKTSAQISPYDCSDMSSYTFTCSYHWNRIDVLWAKHWVKVQHGILGQREARGGWVRGHK